MPKAPPAAQHNGNVDSVLWREPSGGEGETALSP
jgi:hypothetical protein